MICRVRNLCDKSCEFLFTNWLRPTHASQKNAICAQNSPNMSQTVRSLLMALSHSNPLLPASSVSCRARTTTAAATGAPGTFSPPTCLSSGLRTGKPTEEGCKLFARKRGRECETCVEKTNFLIGCKFPPISLNNGSLRESPIPFGYYKFLAEFSSY